MTFLVWSRSRAPGVPPTQPRGAQTHPREPISPQHGRAAACSGNNITAVQPLMLCVNISINAAAQTSQPLFVFFLLAEITQEVTRRFMC